MDTTDGPSTSDKTEAGDKVEGQEGKSTDDNSPKECHICMTEFSNGDKLRILTCFHEFHTGCIDKWIKV